MYIQKLQLADVASNKSFGVDFTTLLYSTY